MSPEAFGEMRLKHFFLKMNEYFEEKQSEFKFYGEIMRLQTAFNLNKNRPEHKQLKPERLWAFPWEEKMSETDRVLAEMDKEKFEANYKAFLGLS